MGLIPEPPIIIYVNEKSVKIVYYEEIIDRIKADNYFLNSDFNYLTLVILSLIPAFVYNLKIVEIENLYLKDPIRKQILEYAKTIADLGFLNKIKKISQSLKDNEELFQLYPNIGLAYNPLIFYDKMSMGMKKGEKNIKKLILQAEVIKENFVKYFLEKGENENFTITEENKDYGSKGINWYYSVNIFSVNKIMNTEVAKVYYHVEVNNENVNLIPLLWFLTVYLEIDIPEEVAFGPGFLNDILENRIKKAKEFLFEYVVEIPGQLVEKICVLASLASVGLLKLSPFLLDQHIEEIYIDSPKHNVYIDHNEWGRCETEISLDEKSISRLITYLKVESGRPLDYGSPSLKTDLNTRIFKTRITVDVHPLIDEGCSLIIRKFRSKPLTIIDLIRNNTLTIEAAAYLLLLLFHQRNILVVGEPSSGKTTLINALDIMTPSCWRRITIEEVIESIDLKKFGKHQVRYRVDPFEINQSKRIIETVKLLHRSPNYVFFGELLTPEHVFIFLQSLESGIRGIQTTHATTPESLIRKWILHYKIPIHSIEHLDIIVHMKREISYNKNRRYINRISEPLLETRENSYEVKLIDLFKYEKEKLILMRDIRESNVFKKISYEEQVKTDVLYKEYLENKWIIEKILAKKIDHNKLNIIFDKINFVRKLNSEYDFEKILKEVNL